MKKAKQFISCRLNETGDYEAFYEYESKINKKARTKSHTLKYAKNANWSHPGKKAYSIVNNGNGFIFTDHLMKKTVEINYCQAEALQVLLDMQDGGDFYYYQGTRKGSKKKTCSGLV